jgi:hypothetical protein
MVESNRYGEALFNLKVYQAFLYPKHQTPSKVEGYRKGRKGVVRRFEVERGRSFTPDCRCRSPPCTHESVGRRLIKREHSNSRGRRKLFNGQSSDKKGGERGATRSEVRGEG